MDYENLTYTEVVERIKQHFPNWEYEKLRKRFIMLRYSIREFLQWCDEWVQATKFLKGV